MDQMTVTLCLDTVKSHYLQLGKVGIEDMEEITSFLEFSHYLFVRGIFNKEEWEDIKIKWEEFYTK